MVRRVPPCVGMFFLRVASPAIQFSNAVQHQQHDRQRQWNREEPASPIPCAPPTLPNQNALQVAAPLDVPGSAPGPDIIHETPLEVFTPSLKDPHSHPEEGGRRSEEIARVADVPRHEVWRRCWA